jgi:hypothetical protein
VASLFDIAFIGDALVGIWREGWLVLLILKASAFLSAARGARLHEIKDRYLNCQSMGVSVLLGSRVGARYDGDGTYDSQVAMILFLWSYEGAAFPKAITKLRSICILPSPS